MKTYRVELTETVTYFTEIDANSLEEALEEGQRLAEHSDFPNGIMELNNSKVTARDEKGHTKTVEW